MDRFREKQGAEALRAYVVGDTSEPIVLSAFRGISLEDRNALVRSHRSELEALDDARLVILESMLLSLDDRAR